MIEDKRLVGDIDIAIEMLESVKYCFERDGFVSENYVLEKCGQAKRCVEFALSLADSED